MTRIFGPSMDLDQAHNYLDNTYQSVVAGSLTTADMNAMRRNLAGIQLDYAGEKWLMRKVVRIELELKAQKGDYNFVSRLAAKTHKVAMEISIGATDRRIADNADNYVFLLDQRHFFYQHIRTLSKWGTDARVRFDGDQLRFAHGAHVNSLRLEAEANKTLKLSLTAFGIRRSSDRRLTPTFSQPNHDGKFYTSIVTDCPTDSLSPLGTHSWLRLYDRNGDVYSVGKYPVDLEYCGLFGQFETEIQIDDNHEWLNRTRKDGSSTIEEKRIEISREEFDRLKNRVQQDLDNGGANQDFAAVDKNCGDYCFEKISEAGIVDVDPNQGRVYYLRFLLPKFANKLVDNVIHFFGNVHGQRLRATMRKVLAVVSPIFNIPALIAGALRGNPLNGHSRATLHNWKDAFRPLYIAHPYSVRKYSRTLPNRSQGLVASA